MHIKQVQTYTPLLNTMFYLIKILKITFKDVYKIIMIFIYININIANEFLKFKYKTDENNQKSQLKKTLQFPRE